MVSVRTPGLSSKLDDAWSGPYEVLRCVTPVTWELEVPDTAKKKQVVHANMLKLWHTVDARVCGGCCCCRRRLCNISTSFTH